MAETPEKTTTPATPKSSPPTNIDPVSGKVRLPEEDITKPGEAIILTGQTKPKSK